jgi:hypothetical protein
MQTITRSRALPAKTKESLDSGDVGAVKMVLLPIWESLKKSVGAESPEAASEIMFEVIGSALPAAMMRTQSRDYVEARLRGLHARTLMLREREGTASAEGAGDLLGVTKQRVLARYSDNSILGVRIAKQKAVLFPVWQFDKESQRVLPGVEAVLQVFKGVAAIDDWAKLTFFLSPRDALEGKAPIDLILSGKTGRAVNLARSYAS